MIKVRNLSTGEVICISQTGRDKSTGRIVTNGTPSKKFLAKYPLTATEEKNAEGDTFMELYDGFELLTGKRVRLPKEAEAPAEAPAAEAVPVKAVPETTEAPVEMEAVIEAEDVKEVPAEAPVEEPKPRREKKAEPKVEATTSDDEDAAVLIAALKRLKGGSVDEATVRQIVSDSINEMLASMDAPKKKVLIAKAKSTKKEVYCEKFERIVAKVSRGNHVYLHGPAGCGKSHTAEQIAERLGLDYYSQTTIQFAHDVRGYGDAGGNFCETPFFKAFSQGGLYFQDEYDRSNSEAAIVLNTALANGYYDFPIVGRVVAHPDFRFIAAGNTLMKGADEEYVSGQPQDASCRDRFGFFFKVNYSREVELAIAHNNTEIVDFVEDVRQAVAACGLQHVVSYRATAAMIDEVEHENDKVACAEECIFKGLETDEIREIYGALTNKENAWARATKKLF